MKAYLSWASFLLVLTTFSFLQVPTFQSWAIVSSTACCHAIKNHYIGGSAQEESAIFIFFLKSHLVQALALLS